MYLDTFRALLKSDWWEQWEMLGGYWDALGALRSLEALRNTGRHWMGSGEQWESVEGYEDAVYGGRD